MDLTAPVRRTPGGDGDAGMGEGRAGAESGAAPPPDSNPAHASDSAPAHASDPGSAPAVDPGSDAPEAQGGVAVAPGALGAEARAASESAAPVHTVPSRRVSLREWIREHDESWIFVVIYLGLAVGLSVFVSLFWLVAVAGLHLAFELVRQAHYRNGRTNVFLHALWEIKLDIGLVLLALMLVLYIEVVLGLLGIQSAARAAAVTRAGARLGSRAAAWERNIRTFLLTVDEMVRVVYAGVMLRKRAKDTEAEAEEALDRPSSGHEGVESELEAAARAAEKAAERRHKVEKEAERRHKAEKAAARRQKVEAALERRRQAAERNVPGGQRDSGAHDGSPAAALAHEEPIAAWRGAWGTADKIGVALVAVGVLLIVMAPYITPHDWGTAATALLGELRPFPE